MFKLLMRFRHLAVLGLLTLLASCAPAHQNLGLGPGRYEEKIPEADQNRSFILDVPKSYNPKKPVAVVVVLHGWTATAAEAERYTQMAREGEAQGFVTVFPDGVGKGWNAGFINLTGSHPDDVKFITDLLDHLEKELNVDKDREYVCGHSNGAFMANYLGAKLSSRLAAIGSVAGSTGTTGAKAQTVPDPDSPISVILIHGKADKMVAYDSDAKAVFHGVGAEDAAEWWAQKDGCGPVPSKTKSSDGNVETELFSTGKGDSEVELVSITNGSHSWPGGWTLDSKGVPVRETATGVDAADLIWQFFKTHPKTGATH